MPVTIQPKEINHHWKRIALLIFASREGISDTLTNMLRTGTQQLIATSVEDELENFWA